VDPTRALARLSRTAGTGQVEAKPCESIEAQVLLQAKNRARAAVLLAAVLFAMTAVRGEDSIAMDRQTCRDSGGAEAQLSYPSSVAIDLVGHVYVADAGHHTIRRIGADGVIVTLAGSVDKIGWSDGVGAAALFYSANGVATDPAGNLYVADTYNNAVRKITPGGVVTTLAGKAGMLGSEDGIGRAARFNNPIGLATDPAANVWVADSYNQTIRRITPSGSVSTVAGAAGMAGSTDGVGGAARFNYPTGVATDLAGNVYVVDSGNSTIRKISPAGVVSTLAGSAGKAGWAGGNAGVARFNHPTGLATDPAGNIYVADTYNDAIRKITPAGVVSTLAGMARRPGAADGIGSAARFDHPLGVGLDANGNVYVADAYNDTIRKISGAGQVTTIVASLGVTPCFSSKSVQKHDLAREEPRRKRRARNGRQCSGGAVDPPAVDLVRIESRHISESTRGVDCKPLRKEIPSWRYEG